MGKKPKEVDLVNINIAVVIENVGMIMKNEQHPFPSVLRYALDWFLRILYTKMVPTVVWKSLEI